MIALLLVLAGCGGEARPAPAVSRPIPEPASAAEPALQPEAAPTPQATPPPEAAPTPTEAAPPTTSAEFAFPAISSDGASLALQLRAVLGGPDSNATLDPWGTGPPGYVALVPIDTAEPPRLLQPMARERDADTWDRIRVDDGYTALDRVCALDAGETTAAGENASMRVELRASDEIAGGAPTGPRGSLLEGPRAIEIVVRLPDGSEWARAQIDGQPPRHRRIPPRCGASFFFDGVTVHAARSQRAIVVQQDYRSGSDECAPFRVTVIGADATGAATAPRTIEDLQFRPLLR